MSMPAILTSPSARASGLVSCMRLRQRMKVDLPQPEGPMTAVACLDSIEMLIPCRASVLPNQAFRSLTSTGVVMSARSFQHAPQENEANQSRCTHNYYNQHECSRPGLPVPLIERRVGGGKNLQRQCGHRLTRTEVPVLIAERGQQQGGGFSGYSGKREHHSGNDSSPGRGQSDRYGGPPLRDSQAKGGLAHRLRYQEQHLFGGARHDGNHHDRQGDSCGETGKMALRENHQPVSDQANHNRWHPVQGIGSEANHISKAAATILRQVNTGADANRHPDGAGDGQNDDGSNDPVGDAPAWFADGLRHLGEKVPAQRSGAL